MSQTHTHTSYAVMKKCWRLSAEQRPRFSELVASLDKTLQTVAGYVELSMTLDQSVVATGEGDMEEDWSGYEVVNPAAEAETSKPVS